MIAASALRKVHEYVCATLTEQVRSNVKNSDLFLTVLQVQNFKAGEHAPHEGLNIERKC